MWAQAGKAVRLLKCEITDCFSEFCDMITEQTVMKKELRGHSAETFRMVKGRGCVRSL